MSCEHLDLEVEIIEVDCMSNGEHDTYETAIYVCRDCDESVDGDPYDE